MLDLWVYKLQCLTTYTRNHFRENVWKERLVKAEVHSRRITIPKIQRSKALVILFPFVCQESEAFANLPLLFLTHTKTSALIEVMVISLFQASQVIRCVNPSSPHSHDGKHAHGANTSQHCDPEDLQHGLWVKTGCTFGPLAGPRWYLFSKQISSSRDLDGMSEWSLNLHKYLGFVHMYIFKHFVFTVAQSGWVRPQKKTLL